MSKDVAKTIAAVEKMAENWPMVDALLGGTAEMRKHPEFLPKWPKEEQAAYDARLKTATLFPAYARTVDILSAKPFQRDLQLSEDTPGRIQEWSADIDLQGRSLHVFAGDILDDAMGRGICGILVEYPKARDVKNQAQQKALGLRPYFIHIRGDQVLGWRATIKNGAMKLTQLRIMECVTEPDGEFLEKEVNQIRVLTPGAWETFRKSSEEQDEWISADKGTTTLDEIPFVPVYGQRTGFMCAIPPLLDVAFMNVEHWQSKSDQQNILHVARVPILVAAGGGENFELIVGSSNAIQMPEGGTLTWTEHEGKAIAAGRQSLLDLQDAMRQAGAELLVIQPVKAVAQVISDNEAGRCVLARIAIDLENSLNQALEIMGRWVGEANGGTVELYKDFGFDTLAAADADLLLKMRQDGDLSRETVFEESKRRGLIDHDRSWEDEQMRLESDGPALGMITDPGALGGNGQ